MTQPESATNRWNKMMILETLPDQPSRLLSFVRSTAAPRSAFLLLMLLLVCGWCDADDAAAAGASPHDVVDWAGMSECRTGKAVARACCCTTGVEQRRKRAWAGALQRQRTSPPLGLPRFPPSPPPHLFPTLLLPLSYPPPLPIPPLIHPLPNSSSFHIFLAPPHAHSPIPFHFQNPLPSSNPSLTHRHASSNTYHHHIHSCHLMFHTSTHSSLI